MRRSLTAVAVLLTTAGPAFAHAHLRSSVPEAASAVTSPNVVEISFTEALEPKFTTIEVVDTAGRRVDKADLHVVGANAQRVAVGLQTLTPGAYTVVWHATSIDTHKTEGTFTFTVTP